VSAGNAPLVESDPLSTEQETAMMSEDAALFRAKKNPPRGTSPKPVSPRPSRPVSQPRVSPR
jgi:hypothetical protein